MYSNHFRMLQLSSLFIPYFIVIYTSAPLNNISHDCLDLLCDTLHLLSKLLTAWPPVRVPLHTHFVNEALYKLKWMNFIYPYLLCQALSKYSAMSAKWLASACTDEKAQKFKNQRKKTVHKTEDCEPQWVHVTDFVCLSFHIFVSSYCFIYYLKMIFS